MSSESPSAFAEAERQAFAFAEEVGGLAGRIVGAAVAEVVFECEADPETLCDVNRWAEHRGEWHWLQTKPP